MKPQNSVESVNIDRALEVFNGNRFYLILAAAQRAKEISSQRIFAERNGDRTKFEHRPTVAALKDIAEGRIGQEYLNKVR